MNESLMKEYAEMGIEARSITQEEADSLGILIHPVKRLDKSKQDTPAEEQLNVHKNIGGIGQQGIQGENDE